MTQSAQPTHEPSAGRTAGSDASIDDSAARSGAKPCIDGGGLISRSESGWTIHVGSEQIELPASTTPAVAAAKFAKQCKTVRGSNHRCVLGLDSSECFFVDFKLPDTIDAKDHTAVSYELERYFPLDAEAMVSMHTIDAARGRIAAIAVETVRHREVVDALENAGIDIVSIIPVALLAARAVQQRAEIPSPFHLLLFNRSSAESLTVESSGVYRWKQFYNADDELRRHQSINADHDEQPVVVVGRKELTFKPTGPVQWHSTSMTRLAAEGASIALRGRWGRWPDLRRDALAPGDPLFAVAGPLRLLGIAAIGCFLILTIAAWYRSARLSDASDSIRQEQRSAFTEAYPSRRIPVMLMRTVRSEHRKTLGSRGQGDSIDLPIPATTVLRDLYQGLEHARRVGGAKMRLVDLDILDGECSLTVRAVDSVHIGSIAKSLETVGFDVEPPATEQIDPSKDEPIATYQSTITATWSPPSVPPTDGDAS